MVDTSGVGAIVDLDAAPLDRLDSAAGQALIDSCLAQMQRYGACLVPGFLTPSAIASMVSLGRRLAGEAWTTEDRHTVTFEAVDDSVPASDPRARLVSTREHTIAFDRLPSDAPVRLLYEWEPLLEFVRRVLSLDELHRSADPLDAVNIARFDAGDELGWHFDNSDFSVTLMYQPAEQGGTFEFVPAVRTPDDPNHAGVEAVLDGAITPEVLDIPAGTLCLFRGRYSLHRVTPVAGERPRLNSVLTYRERPGLQLTPETRLLFYGRAS